MEVPSQCTPVDARRERSADEPPAVEEAERAEEPEGPVDDDGAEAGRGLHVSRALGSSEYSDILVGNNGHVES
jgi:hypothetical protein